jgi:hypothetical protein
MSHGRRREGERAAADTLGRRGPLYRDNVF